MATRAPSTAATTSSLPVIDFASEAGAIGFEHGIVFHDAAEYRFPSLLPEVLAVLEDGGLIQHAKKVLRTG